MNNNWYILGAGSIGCLWAAKLCQAGITPTLILRPQRYQQLARNTIQLKQTNLDGCHYEYSVKVTSADQISTPINTLIVCTKAQHATRAVQSVKHRLTHNSHLLLLQNGMGSQQEIVDSLPTQTIWAASVTDGAFLQAPFNVCHAGKGTTSIGKISQTSAPSDSCLNDTLEKLDLNIQETPHIEQKLWEKLAINCCINGLTALYNCKNGELLDDSKKHHLYRVINETQSILEKSDKMPDLCLKEAVIQVCHNTAENISSTCQDARSGRSTELAYINGFLLNVAKKTSVILKEHSQLLSRLQQIGVQI